MSTTKKGVAIATVVALFAVGFAVYQVIAYRESATALSAVSQERDDLRARLSVTDKKLQQTQHDLTAVQKERADAIAAAAKAPAIKAPPSARPRPAHPLEAILDHPELHAAYVQREVLREKAKFEGFFRAAGLSVEQQAALLQVLKARKEAELDLMLAIRAQGYGTNGQPVDPESVKQLNALAKQTAEKFQTDLKESLGADRYDQYRHYAKTLTERKDCFVALLLAMTSPRRLVPDFLSSTLKPKRVGPHFPSFAINPSETVPTPGTQSAGGSARCRRGRRGARRSRWRT